MFTDHSHLLSPNPPLLAYGVCVFDADGDGAFEFFVAGFGAPSRLLKWNGNVYADVTPRVLASAERQSIGVAAADIDADGREELYVLNTDTFAGAKRFGDHLFSWDGDDDGDGWRDLFGLAENHAILNRVAGRSVCAVDRSGDGRYGFFVANYGIGRGGGPMRLYELAQPNSDDDRTLADVAGDAGIDLIAGGRSLVSLPLVSDGMDIFAANENGPNFLFHNNGDGTFEEVAAELGLDDPTEHGRGIAVLDADGNGRFDLCIGNWQGAQRLFLQSPIGGFHNVADGALSAPAKVRTVIAADFDNDGYEEIFFNNIGEPNRLFGLRDGVWTSLPLGDALEPFGQGTGAAVADLDGDGRLELLIAHGENDAEPLSLYRPEANDNAWIRIQPVTQFGAPARGAIVTLMTKSRIQRRAICAGSGYLCQMEPVAHFGLGAETEVEQVSIRWPDGTVAIHYTPEIRQTMRVIHPDTGPWS